MNIMGVHRLAVIEECIVALANCREAGASTTLVAPHMMHMTPDEVVYHTRHDLARRLAVLLVDDAEITQGIVWAEHPGRNPHEIDTEFTARTVVMKASTYHQLCQALRHLQQEALNDKFRVMP